MAKSTRKSDRVNLKIAVQLEHDSQLQRFYSQNISGGGIFLEVHTLIPLDQEVNLSFNIPGQAKPMQLRAKVVRHHAMQTMDDDMNPKTVQGVGLAFVQLSPEDQKIIEQFVAGKGLTLQG